MTRLEQAKELQTRAEIELQVWQEIHAMSSRNLSMKERQLEGCINEVERAEDEQETARNA